VYKCHVVKLDRIYTRGGDKGETSLGDGTRAPKHAARIAAVGEVDEANAAIGLVRAGLADGPLDAALARIQNELFDLGADLCVPEDAAGRARLRVTAAQVARLEAEIDGANESLAPLDSFVLPGGTETASRLHLARTVVRRAERAASALAAAEPVNPVALAYLNRLSDLLFVLARAANDGGAGDVKWSPGATR
jgi:cob(I)alamin adenosyltransferase